MTDALAGLVLAGGASRRMGGGDKFLLELGEQSLLERAIGRLKPQVDEIAISANCDPALLADYPYPILPDQPPAGRGPLAGIMAGLDWAADRTSAAHMVTIASDTPFFPADLVQRFLLAAEDDGSRVVLAASAGRIHPVFGFWPISLRPSLRDWLAKGDSLKVADFVESRPWIACEFTFRGDADPFFNINTPGDLASAGDRLVSGAT